jgi:hypothetical protein
MPWGVVSLVTCDSALFESIFYVLEEGLHMPTLIVGYRGFFSLS